MTVVFLLVIIIFVSAHMSWLSTQFRLAQLDSSRNNLFRLRDKVRE